ncbi:MAG: hypothetical protein QT05_C0003G0008 [archaeon GW2011_AR13]|nr:MAG: hypothetical protein QT05_C0003G0008 [archaeon GW2011_AR13]HIG94227.1 hypothetical protein [Nanoarchaeota archaeon]HIH62663.1 hypothetical protein [Nanoarchaeota archaeon]HIJ09870.1 hypothetical protein [Nanoarchaeota archaeon]
MTEKIFLKDYSILHWERPVKEGVDSMLWMYNGSTKLVEQIGFDLLNETIGQFKIFSSATKYLADIVHLGEDYLSMGEPISGEEKREILFVGGLTIYIEGQIPGTDIQGYDFEKHEKIWIAKSPEEKYCSSNGLRDLILENSSNPKERIEAILLGYQTQEDNKKNAQDRRDYDSWKRGRMQGQDEGPIF